MGKRKEEEQEGEELETSSQGEGDQDMEEIQVNFDFFDPKEVDFFNIKTFLQQLFGSDILDTSEVSNLIIKQPLIGTTIKAESEDDCLAIFTCLNLNVHKENPAIVQFLSYIRNSMEDFPHILNLLEESMSSEVNGGKDIGWLVNERLVNMPVAVVPPMYTMLGEELDWAIQDGEPYNFAYYLLISKTYTEVEPTTNYEGSSKELKGKRNKSQPSGKVGYVHLEDEIVIQHAEAVIPLKFQEERVPDANRVFNEFGIVPGRLLFVLKKEKMVGLVEALKSAIPQP